MISVCIATHNGERYIETQLASILSQIGPDDEIVISDDGSTDRTLEIVNGLGDNRINVFNYIQPQATKHPHEYVCHNFQNALQNAQGDFIFLSDQDDEWMPDKVEVCMALLKDYDLVLHDFCHIDEQGNVIQQLHYDGGFRDRNFFMARGKHYGCAMAFRKEVLAYALPFPKHLLLHDFWIGLLAETLGSFHFEPTPLIRYRIHQQNTSETNNSLWFKLSYRFSTIWHLFIRIVKYKLTGTSNL